jgi:hypothetical protein
MSDTEKTNYTKIGLALAGIAVSKQTAELLWRTVDGINAKKGQFSLSDQCDIERIVFGKIRPKSFKMVRTRNSKKKQ